jgi:hypothetical protein
VTTEGDRGDLLSPGVVAADPVCAPWRYGTISAAMIARTQMAPEMANDIA